MQRSKIRTWREGELKNKDVLVVGLARSGVGAANLLSYFGAKVSVTDIKPEKLLRNNIRRLSPAISRISVGGHPEELFDTAELIVLSPGVPVNMPQIREAKSSGIPVIGELELAYKIAASDKLRVMHKKQRTVSLSLTHHLLPAFIGVTGTNGKSTTSTLIDMMLKKAGFRTLLGGNIGNALTEEIHKELGAGGKGIKDGSPHYSRLAAIDYIVAEVSSFQLEAVQDFRPLVAVILNLTPDHLDRYCSMQKYIDAKAEIFRNQNTGDYLILNADDPLVMELYKTKFNDRISELNNINILFFSRKKEVEGIYCKENSIFCSLLSTSRTAPPARFEQERGAVSSPFELIKVNEIKMKGAHNIENAMAASLAGLIAGCPIDSVIDVLGSFPGLEHRLEPVCEIKGVSFINDSKGTNTGAVIKSLEGLENVVLIMGGKDKGSNFRVLRDLIKKKVKTLILLGEAREKIAGAIGDLTNTILVKNIKEAVEVSMSKASRGDIVLLSPGCTSFDMFESFEERGKEFKEAVENIRKSLTSNK